jgi:hypothetical protein
MQRSDLVVRSQKANLFAFELWTISQISDESPQYIDPD